MKRTVVVTALALLALLSVLFLIQQLSVGVKKEPSVQREHVTELSPSPPESPLPHRVFAEPATPCTQNVSEDIRPALPSVPPVQQMPNVPVEEPPTPTPTATLEPIALPSHIYFFTGVPARLAPTTALIYTVPVPMPTVQSYAVPVFVPQVVPSRVGAPKLVYPNGVVIKPQVYFPHQPVRNVVRGVTP